MSLFRVNGLKIHFPVHSGWLRRQTDCVKAVDDVSFEIEEGRTLGLVGESGSGKSTVARSLLKLIPHTAGEAYYRDQEILSLPLHPQLTDHNVQEVVSALKKVLHHARA